MQNREEVEEYMVFTTCFKERAMKQLVTELGNLNDRDLIITATLLLSLKDPEDLPDRDEMLLKLYSWGEENVDFLGKEWKSLDEERKQRRRIFIDAITRARKKNLENLQRVVWTN